MGRLSTFQSELVSFGLATTSRISIFKEIHEIIFHGQGGYDWETVYNMPIWLRRFTFNTLKEYYEKQNESSTASTDPNKTLMPGVVPKAPKANYQTKTTQAAKK